MGSPGPRRVARPTAGPVRRMGPSKREEVGEAHAGASILGLTNERRRLRIVKLQEGKSERLCAVTGPCPLLDIRYIGDTSLTDYVTIPPVKHAACQLPELAAWKP